MTRRSQPSADDAIILYDGVCLFCSAWVRFIVKRDVACLFRFTPIQSPYGRELAETLGIDPDDPDTNAVVLNGQAYRRSDAALTVVSKLPGWKWVRLGFLVPRALRDIVYNFVARNRYRLFGRSTTCDVSGALAERIVTDRNNEDGDSHPVSPPIRASTQ
jgi:predicted DCC family thiol-disulfide oxidoreductase YuxK